MRSILVVAVRELVEKRNAFLAAAVCSVMPFLAPLAPWLQRQPAGDVRGATAMVIALVFAGGLAIAHGSSMIGRDLAERRLSFYFNRPLAPFAIWGGKLLAGVVLMWATPAIVLLPAALASGQGHQAIPILVDMLPALGVVAALTVLLLGLSHAVGIVLRDRSAWLVADLMALAVLAAIVLWSLKSLLDVAAYGAVWVIVWLLFGVVFAAVLLSGAVQVACGRTDSRRGHRALSVALWGVLLATAAGLACYAAWVVATPLSAVRRVHFAAVAPSGPWVMVAGEAPRRGGVEWVWLLDSSTGRHIRIGPDEFEGALRFSQDGHRVAWVEETPGWKVPAWTQGMLGVAATGTAQVIVLDLSSGSLEPKVTTLVFQHRWPYIALAESGRELAIVQEKTLSVYEVTSERLIASAQLPGDNQWAAASFVGNDSILLWCRDGVLQRALRLYKLEGPAPRLVDAGAVFGVSDWFLDTSRQRLLVATGPEIFEETWTERDPHTWELQRTFEREPGWKQREACILADGRVVVAEMGDDRARLRVWEQSGTPPREVSVGSASWIQLEREIRPGVLLVESGRPHSPKGAWPAQLTLVVDVDGPKVSLFEQDLDSSVIYSPWQGVRNAEPGGLASTLFVSRDGQLIVRDPETGARRTLVPLS